MKQHKPMDIKQEILAEFDVKFPLNLELTDDQQAMSEEEKVEVVRNTIKNFLSQAIDKVRKERDGEIIQALYELPHRDNCAMYKGEQTESCSCGLAKETTDCIYLINSLSPKKGEEET